MSLVFYTPRSKVKVMPSTLATSIHLDTQPVSPLNPSKTKCKSLKEIVNGDQKDESSLSKSKYEHSPRVNGKDVTQKDIDKGLLPTLSNNGSKVI